MSVFFLSWPKGFASWFAPEAPKDGIRPHSPLLFKIPPPNLFDAKLGGKALDRIRDCYLGESSPPVTEDEMHPIAVFHGHGILHAAFPGMHQWMGRRFNHFVVCVNVVTALVLSALLGMAIWIYGCLKHSSWFVGAETDAPTLWLWLLLWFVPMSIAIWMLLANGFLARKQTMDAAYLLSKVDLIGLSRRFAKEGGAKARALPETAVSPPENAGPQSDVPSMERLTPMEIAARLRRGLPVEPVAPRPKERPPAPAPAKKASPKKKSVAKKKPATMKKTPAKKKPVAKKRAAKKSSK